MSSCLVLYVRRTICSDSNSEVLVSLSIPSDYQKPYQVLTTPQSRLQTVFQLHATTYPFPSPKSPSLVFTTECYLLSLLFHFPQLKLSFIHPFHLSSMCQQACPLHLILRLHRLMQKGCCQDATPLLHGVLLILVGISKLYLGEEITDPRTTC